MEKKYKWRSRYGDSEVIMGRKRKLFRHGKCASKTYHMWERMKQRCFDVDYPAYKHYGAKGIGICKKWLTFVNFYNDMGKMPRGHSLDRKDYDLGY